jgi:hypothetical protein
MRPIATLSVSRGDRRMRGRTQLNTTPDAEGSTAIEYKFAAPSELRAGGFWTNANQRGGLTDLGGHGAATFAVGLRSVAMRDQRDDVWLPDGDMSGWSRRCRQVHQWRFK